MSDYYFEVDVLRDQMATKLSDNLEQTPYVFAEVAKDIVPDSAYFTEFCDLVDNLDGGQKEALQQFCAALAKHLSPEIKKETPND
ncbi:hypothetical protein [Roseobacter sp. OBYS 0001]|uniref:hypothetical protein n=1 Tax=Roseobacter sp. OBYS 0001 TaxID=882651 RepID=UPI001BC42A86|nr:hypothetical protein [Roseobacter sp. OBYS 0001]GIT85432.1 hypothetical protein ROBYS_04480 [Roseobacter sp. OBYS 0001]